MKRDLVLKILHISSHIDTTLFCAGIIFVLSVAFSWQIYEIFKTELLQVMKWMRISRIDTKKLKGKLLILHSKTAVEKG